MSSIVKPTRSAALLCAAVLCLLTACATTGPGVSGERRAENLARSGQHAEAAAYYIDLATRAAAGEEQDRLTLLAIEQWLDAGDGPRARNALRTVAKPPEGELRWLWTSNAAAVALWEGQPDDALELLEPLAQEPLSLRYRSRVEALRADAWFQKDEPARAVELYLQRESWLDDPALLELSRRRLWAGLLVSDPQTLQTAAERVSQPAVKGWLELGALATSTGQSGVGWRSGVVRWQESWRRHPANVVLEGLALPEGEDAGFPRQIALLLPLSGQNAAAGSAIRNGFLGAYFAAATELDDEQQIRLYDVNGSGAPRAYDRAVTDGAEFVVGPLLRPDVAALAAQAPLPVPVLTLNYLPEEGFAPAGFYQFALAPEDEAVSAADRALADGHRRAVALVPNNDWGRRILSSFASAFEAGGGVLLEYRDYRPTMQDFSFEIESLMALTESVQRYQRLRANIGGPLQFDPRRRQDVEFVFLAADAKAGRLIKSQLKFHYAGDLPVYSTSFIYSMDGRSNSDLNGVMFADTPWVVAPRPWMSHLPGLYNEYWPDERRLARLHAMGYDAYQLVAELHAAGSRPMPELSGATGRLYLDGQGRVHRRLAWARFVGGQPVALEMDRPGEPGELDELDEADLPGPWQRRPLNP